MDYNTQRRQLLLPEYGRHVQQMVDYLLTIPDREKRSEQAAIVVRVMLAQNPQLKRVEAQERKVWEHLYIMSGYQLDVEAKFPLQRPETLRHETPQLPYPERKQRFNHYGSLIPKMLNEIATLPASTDKQTFALQTANQMKRCYLEWNKSTVTDQEILNDLKNISDGRIELQETQLDEMYATQQATTAVQNKNQQNTAGLVNTNNPNYNRKQQVPNKGRAFHRNRRRRNAQ